MHTGDGYHIGSSPGFWRSSFGTLDLVRPFSGCMEIAGYALSRFPSPFRAGGKESKMSTSYLKEFDYDLWTTNDGAHCWVRIKSTGEEAEISREVLRELQKEQEQLKRIKKEPKADAGKAAMRAYEITHPLTLDAIPIESDEDLTPTWLISRTTPESESLAAELEQQLLDALTERQKDCYYSCVIYGESRFDYAKRTGISAARVTEIFAQIAQKLKKL